MLGGQVKRFLEFSIKIDHFAERECNVAYMVHCNNIDGTEIQVLVWYMIGLMEGQGIVMIMKSKREVYMLEFAIQVNPM